MREYTWFGGRTKFVSGPGCGSSSRGSTARECLENIRTQHQKEIDTINAMLASTAPEDAEVLVKNEIAEDHPTGMGRHCNCAHTAEIRIPISGVLRKFDLGMVGST